MSGTIAIKVDDALRARLKAAAATMGRSPHWLARTGVIAAIEKAERGERFDAEAGPEPLPQPLQGPFVAFARDLPPQSALRARITAATRMPETECLPLLIPQARLDSEARTRAERTARGLVERLRLKEPAGRVDGLVREYALSTQEGVALMCLAEALLRIPDRPTREALIRDKISAGDWRAHVGHSPSLFVNAATWGLVVTGKLNTTNSERGLSAALTRLIGKGGEPLIRKGVEIAMRLMGEQFVTGQTIGEALANSRRMEAKGFRYSYDMLGEAAMTADDAARYLADYEQAIHAIGKAAGGRGIYEGPGISVKLSALHPRYARAQRGRVMAELLPRLKGLAVLAKRYDIGLNIDAEEADRLEISLDLLEALAFDSELAGWNGIGFVIQAYGKRCPFVIDWLIDLARRSRRRIMVRLVKGAYWDSEIKRAQEAGLEDFPVFTRKLHTDVSYLACARRLLAAPDAIFPQFATHNAQTLAAVVEMAGANYYPGQYEFQCLHGMGEPLYEEVVGESKLGRPCRIYAPVGTHDTLLAYLLRRLLENGANTSFVNRISDPEVPVEALIADPVMESLAVEPVGAPHPKIALPRALYGARQNSAGIDLANEQRLAALGVALIGSATTPWLAAPLVGDEALSGDEVDILNPADRRDRVGGMVVAAPEAIDAAFAAAEAIAPIWGATPADERAAALERAADALETRLPEMVGLIVREAGRTIPNAVAEVREAVDFLRYYAGEARARFAADTHRPVGPVVAISPWNFPLAIFTGQVAAALAAGNPVLAKPAEETPLIAAEAVRILRASGVPAAAVQLLPGAGDVGAALVADPRVRGVVFTGSTEVARAINRSLASRLTPDGRTLPLIAETGGQNAMVVDSSALAEQVAGDAILSAFDSAGQRCSALRILCVQDDVADRMIAMLEGAMAELSLGDPALLSTDIGPVISQEATERLEAHIAAMAARGFKVHRLAQGDAGAHGSFVAPALIEIDAIEDVPGEVFGPVLHVLRYKRDGLDLLVDAINGTGYGLTFGLHTRIDETISAVTARIHAGNLYVNRNVVGAVVGVQPFGGNGLSGTGPKAGGPLYLGRLVQPHDEAVGAAIPSTAPDPVAAAFADWLARRGDPDGAARMRGIIGRGGVGAERLLAGPVGQRDSYFTRPRGRVLIKAQTPAGLTTALGAVLATGNRALLSPGEDSAALLASLPPEIAHRIDVVQDAEDMPLGAVLHEGDADRLAVLAARIAARAGAIVAVHAVSSDGLAAGRETFYLDGLVEEVSLSINTAAAGGNASLMSIG